MDSLLVVSILVPLLAWDIGRRFADKGKQVTVEDLEEQAQELEDLTTRIAQVATEVQDQTKALTDLKAVVANHAQVLGAHGRTLTNLGLNPAAAKAMVRGK